MPRTHLALPQTPPPQTAWRCSPERWSRFFEQNLRVVKWTPAGLRRSAGQLKLSRAARALCCHAARQRGVVGLIGSAPVKRGVRTSPVVKFQKSADRRARLRHALVGPEVDLLVLQGAPEAFDEHVVPPSPL